MVPLKTLTKETLQRAATMIEYISLKRWDLEGIDDYYVFFCNKFFYNLNNLVHFLSQLISHNLKMVVN